MSLNVRFLVICMYSLRFSTFQYAFHAFATLLILSPRCHYFITLSLIRYIVILSAAKNLKPHHSTCPIKRALRIYCHSERSEESQCPVCICGSLTIQKARRPLSSSSAQLDAAQEQVRYTGEYQTEFKADIHSIGRIEQISDGTNIVHLCGPK